MSKADYVRTNESNGKDNETNSFVCLSLYCTSEMLEYGARLRHQRASISSKALAMMKGVKSSYEIETWENKNSKRRGRHGSSVGELEHLEGGECCHAMEEGYCSV